MVAKISDQALIDSSRAGEPSPTAAQHLGQTALKLFARKGYTATSVNEIVEAAGVTKPMLYYYYGSKEQLARRLVVEPLEKLTEKLKALEFDSADPLDREIGWLTAQLEFCREDADRARFVFALYFGPCGIRPPRETNHSEHCQNSPAFRGFLRRIDPRLRSRNSWTNGIDCYRDSLH